MSALPPASKANLSEPVHDAIGVEGGELSKSDQSQSVDRQVEARFIAQEHRFPHIIFNFWARRAWSIDDPRRAAAVQALVWRAFSPGTAAVAGGGIVAVATLAILVWQTSLIGEQNRYFAEQNTKLQQQIDTQAAQDLGRRRTEIIANLYERSTSNLAGLSTPRANARTRSESVREFLSLERSRLGLGSRLNLQGALLQNTTLEGLDFSNTDLMMASLDNTTFAGANLDDCDLRAAIFLNANLPGASMRRVNLEGCDLQAARLGNADLRGAVLNSAKLQGVLLLGADLRDASLAFVKGWQELESVAHANIHGVKNAPDGFREWALNAGAVDEPNDSKWIEYRTHLGLTTRKP
jgi:uncharacterized protein YjbI with pentapeptide repeats